MHFSGKVAGLLAASALIGLTACSSAPSAPDSTQPTPEVTKTAGTVFPSGVTMTTYVGNGYVANFPTIKGVTTITHDRPCGDMTPCVYYASSATSAETQLVSLKNGRGYCKLSVTQYYNSNTFWDNCWNPVDYEVDTIDVPQKYIANALQLAEFWYNCDDVKQLTVDGTPALLCYGGIESRQYYLLVVRSNKLFAVHSNESNAMQFLKGFSLTH